MFGIKSYIIYAIGIGLGLLGTSYFVTNYFNMKASLRITRQQLTLAEHRRQATESAMVEVEHEIDKNLTIQRKALLEMDQQGYLPGTGNRNPQWMLDYETPGS